MRKVNFKNIGLMIKNSFSQNWIRPNSQFEITNMKGEIKMESQKHRRTPKQLLSLGVIFFSLLTTLSVFNSCSDPSSAGVQNTETNISGAENIRVPDRPDSTHIKLDVNVSFKSQSISESKFLESNIGNTFNHIVSVNHDLGPGEVLDLQELQPTGIFSLYLSANGTFSLSNSDGMSFSSKTLLIEKCSFIDLKLKNEGYKVMHVSGFVAGE